MKPCALYAAIHIATGRVYIGVSVQPKVRWNQHWHDCKKAPEGFFHRALAKYGRDAFAWRIVDWFETIEDAKLAEIRAIAAGLTAFNLTAGGDGVSGYRPPAEVREKMAAAKRGRANPAVGAANRRRYAEGTLKGFLPRTHCQKGHELTPENRYTSGTGCCKICCKARAKARKAKLKNAKRAK